MATLVLSTVGSVIGGPVGSMVGALAGQYIDQNILFKPKARHGPRLTDFSVQASTYGVQIPRIYGRMRVAGQVIWATPLKEVRHKQKAKGQPDQVSYSYSASFAVALSSRPLMGIRRIWADGTIIRTAGTGWTRDVAMRFHDGAADQPPDPLIASAEGIATTPAYRGLAYVVFEDLPLADYGNRIPALTFEVDADPGDAIDAGAIAADLIPALVPIRDPDRPLWDITGYAASGDTVRSALLPLIDVADWKLTRTAAGLQLGSRPAVIALAPEAIQSAKEVPCVETNRAALTRAPRAIALRHYDPDRDFQVGLQRATVAGGGARDRLLEVPMALSAPQAKALAQLYAGRDAVGRETLRLPVGPQALALLPGALVTVPARGGLWCVHRWHWDESGGHIDLVRQPATAGPGNAGHPEAPPLPVADPGRALPSPEGGSGALHVALFDVPGWHTGASDRPLVAVCVASEAGRGSADIAIRSAPDADPVPIARALDADVLGYADTVLGTGDIWLFDDRASVEVTLVNPAMELGNASDAALLAGANIAMLGGELFQFGRAQALGDRRYRLTHLLRGRGGTRDTTTGHAIGEAFALLPADLGSLLMLPAQIGLMPLAPGMTVEARRPGSDQIVLAATGEVDRALRPLAPVHLAADRREDGGWDLRWVRCSRSGWEWTDGVDAPIGEAAILYRLTISPLTDPSGDPMDDAPVTITVTEPAYTLDSAVVAALRDQGATRLRILVAQSGTFRLSPPATLILSL